MSENILTREEVERDLSNTESDISALSKITDGLRTFIYFNGGEDRNNYRMDLFRYETLLDQASKLRSKIKKVLETL